jgi:hypothetical protein
MGNPLADHHISPSMTILPYCGYPGIPHFQKQIDQDVLQDMSKCGSIALDTIDRVAHDTH